MSENILEVKNLTKSYEKGNIVLNNISFSLKKGEVVVVIGPSGCGKSTFLRCLNRLEEIDSGTITLNGKEISTENNKVNEIREKIGMVFQSYELFPNMNIMKNLILAPTLVQKRNKEEAKAEEQANASPRMTSENTTAFPAFLRQIFSKRPSSIPENPGSDSYSFHEE